MKSDGWREVEFTKFEYPTRRHFKDIAIPFVVVIVLVPLTYSFLAFLQLDTVLL